MLYLSVMDCEAPPPMLTVMGKVALVVPMVFASSVMVGFCTPEAVVTFAVVPYAVAVPALSAPL